MTKLFGSQTTENVERSGDRLGGGRALVDTGVYDATIKAAYVQKSQSSASQGIVVVLDVNGIEVSDTFWITNKEGKNTYTVKGSGKQALLGGYDDMDQFSLLATGVPLNEADFEEKMVQVYDFDQQANVNVARPTMVDAIGEKITVGIHRVKENKRTKGDDGEYHNTAETRELNNIVKFFQIDTGLTVDEIKAGRENPDFINRWKERFGNEVIDKVESVGGKAGAPAAKGPPERAAAASAGGGIFKKKS